MEKISAPLSKLLLFSLSVPETGGKFSSNIPYKNSTPPPQRGKKRMCIKCRFPSMTDPSRIVNSQAHLPTASNSSSN